MPAGQSLKILVADDNEINLKVIIGMLEFAGHEVDAACSGEGVLNALEAKPYQLVILDCLMPGMDGFETARKIRLADGSKFDPDIPILAVTALATKQDRKRCLEAGMTGFCSKPVQMKTLLGWIEKQFGFQKLPAEHKILTSESLVETGLRSDNHISTGGIQRELVSNLSGLLIADATLWKQRLPELLASHDLSGIARLAHKIRGTADVMGFRDLSTLAAQLENSAETAEASHTSLQVSQLLAALQRVIGEVQGQA